MRVPTTVPFFSVRDIYGKIQIKTMGKYLKKFQNHNAYNAFTNTDGFIKPNVSLCVQENEVHYNPWTWAEEYLTTVALEDGTISFNIWQSMGTDMITSISYSTDNGETWTTTNNVNNKEEHLVIDVDVEEGDKVMWKGIATQMGYWDEDEYGDYVGSFFSSTCEFDAKGNIMSLLYGDNFKGETTIEEDGIFCWLFSDYNEEKTCGIVNAKDLPLPATTLAEGCYRGMFKNCTNLVTTPELPATTLTNFCYSNMFNGCTSLETAPELLATTLADYCYDSMFERCSSLATAPELPATTMAEYCYQYMFNGCTSLVTAPELPATTMANSCYWYMFQGCTSLVTAPELPATTLDGYCYDDMFRDCTNLTAAPELPATTLAEHCYSNMFYGCTSLATAPELPATTLANYCYSYMFEGCTSLVNTPELPATTLTNWCYHSMFYGCTSLTTAPELPATTLVQSCYCDMFYGCTSLNYIKAMFTTTPSSSYTNNWVSGVSATGTFVKNSAATWTTTGNNGVPRGWTVQTTSA